jgi:hypothetical protein
VASDDALVPDDSQLSDQYRNYLLSDRGSQPPRYRFLEVDWPSEYEGPENERSEWLVSLGFLSARDPHDPELPFALWRTRRHRDAGDFDLPSDVIATGESVSTLVGGSTDREAHSRLATT